METKEKMDTDSIVAKPEYAASEYSTEAPPAYKLQSTNSIKIAKIISFTIILSSIILGSFLLASTYLQAKATCDQVSALDAVLDKELMLEAMQQDIPRSEALQTREAANNVVQDLSKDEMNKPNKKDETNPDDVEAINTENEIDSYDDDSLKKIRVKLPLDFDLTELAHNLLMNNQKSRMNCVVERRHTEEMNENPMKAMNPFSAFLGEEQPKEKVTGERVSIFCETGAPKEQEPVVHVRRIIMPFPFGGPGPMHRFGPQMPQNQPPFPMPGQNQPPFQMSQFQPQNQMNFPQQNQINFPPQNQINFPPQMRIPFQQPQMPFHPPQNMPMPMHHQQQQQEEFPPIPAQMMSPPRPEIPQFRLINPAQPQQNQLPNFERPNFDRPNFDRPNFERPNFERPQQPENEMIPQPEVRIQLRRIQVPGPISDIFPFLNNLNNMNNEKDIEARPNLQVQQVPLAVALSKVGITPDDLRNIQRMAEEKFQQHIRELVAADDEDSSGDSDSNQSDEEDEVTKPEIAQEEKSSEEKKQESAQEDKNEDAPQILALGRSNFGRSLNPIQLPIRPEIQEAERADFVQPR